MGWGPSFSEVYVPNLPLIEHRTLKMFLLVDGWVVSDGGGCIVIVFFANLDHQIYWILGKPQLLKDY